MTVGNRIPDWAWNTIAALALAVASVSAAIVREHDLAIPAMKSEIQALRDNLREIREDTREIRKALGIGRPPPP